MVKFLLGALLLVFATFAVAALAIHLRSGTIRRWQRTLTRQANPLLYRFWVLLGALAAAVQIWAALLLLRHA
ncbi:MAG TPA: hypothetical protein VKR31_01005 [Rhizomicrobium sp.]|nr:hypothetical protein [Rhizomicrobium sp.]